MIEKDKVDMYIMSNAKFFPEDKVVYLREKIENMDESKYSLLMGVDLKAPTTMLIISILLGSLGVDRFMIGDTGMGILKLLTCGCCGILTIVDWFTISKKVKEQNLNKVLQFI